MSEADTSTGRPVQGEFVGMPPKLYAASPSRLLTLVDCPRRYRMQYLDRPRPDARPQRAHTSFGLAVHNALRDWWDLPRERRTASAGRELVRESWIDVGFRDSEQSATWRRRAQEHVTAYLSRVDPDAHPTGIERTVSFISGALRVTGRIDRLDDRGGELVVVDYKTNQRPLGEDDARTSLPMALYAAAVWKMFRRPCLRVELHHVPSGEVVAHTHTPESLTRKVDEAKSIARDAQRADADFAERGVESTLFPPVVGPLCTWCDFRAHCPEGQTAGPEKSGWAALETAEVIEAAGGAQAPVPVALSDRGARVEP